MPNLIRSVTVFCSSSSKVAPVFQEAAHDLGAAIAREGWKLVYGGNDTGMMGKLANAARTHGGKVIGITPKLFVDNGVCDDKCDELIVVDNMRQRKQILEERGDAFVALPGGVGTLEEWFEALVGRQLKFHSKPVVLMNIEGFYDPLLKMIDDGIEQNFVRPKSRELFFVANSVQHVIEHLRYHKPVEIDLKAATHEMSRQ